MPRRALAMRGRFQNGMVVEWHVWIKHGRNYKSNGKDKSKPLGQRHGMCESNTAALCKSNGKDKSKPLGKRHGMCESNTAALCKSNGKYAIQNPQRNGMGCVN
jgi:hypothetical protein